VEWKAPKGEGVRVDSHCYSGYFVPPYYDSLLAKLITAGSDRPQAIHSMQEALARFVVSGIDTTIPFHQFIMKNAHYLSGDVSTGWIEKSLVKEYERNEGNSFR
jgi:acetyl-CoA carboxylase biotin carboxylase subunit